MVQIGQVIITDGEGQGFVDSWKVESTGKVNEETGEVVAHLSSLTRGIKGLKRDTPIQVLVWINSTTFETRAF